jgi:hypothetical protein
MDYSFTKTLVKGVKYVVLFALPILVNQFIVAYPQWAQLTLGGVLVMIVNWLKNYWEVRLP